MVVAPTRGGGPARRRMRNGPMAHQLLHLLRAAAALVTRAVLVALGLAATGGGDFPRF